ncbi:MAG: GspE/PulE family protein [Pseudomonadota bacterium]
MRLETTVTPSGTVGEPMEGVRIVADGDDRLTALMEAQDGLSALLAFQRRQARPVDLRFVTSAHDAPSGHTQVLSEAAADRIVDILIDDAVLRHASDVHLEPVPEGGALRLRVNGALVEPLRFDRAVFETLVARICVRAGVDSKPALAAEGTLTSGAHAPLRVAMLIRGDGPHILLRRPVVAPGNDALVALGMAPALVARLEPVLVRGGGLIVVAGETGSGRTTTTHAMMQRLNDGTRNLIAVGDASDRPLPGVGHVDVDKAAGLTPALALGAVLRQDPDAVLLGAISDRALLLAALRAAQSGRLVLAKVDAPDAVTAITALRGMKVEPLLLASALRLVLAQRQALRLCGACRQPVQAQGSVSALLGFDPGAVVYAPVGCPECDETGYAGHVGVFEAIHVDPAIQRLIQDGGDEAILARHAYLNAPNLGSAARALVREGITTPDEAVRLSRSVQRVPKAVTTPDDQPVVARA